MQGVLESKPLRVCRMQGTVWVARRRLKPDAAGHDTQVGHLPCKNGFVGVKVMCCPSILENPFWM